jgi:glycosyltransferase involved in cell wall biosynthesis
MADFRDPWTDINYYHELPHTPLARRLDAALERRVLTEASGVVTVSPTWCDLLRTKGAEPVHLVQNGFDPADFPRFAYASSDAAFVLTHVGSLYASRNPEPLWAMLARLRAAGRLPKLRLRLVGRVDAAVRASLARHGLAEVTEFVGYVPHEEAIAYMQRASMLLLLVEPFPADAGMITGKVYEYMAAGRPVLGVGPADGDAAALLEGTMAGMLFDRDDTAGAAAFVQGHYASWTHGVTPTGAPPYAMHGYSRQAQTAALADALFLLPDPPPLGPAPARDAASGGASARPSTPRPTRSPHPA